MKYICLLLCIVTMMSVVESVKSATTCRQYQLCDQCLNDPGCGWCDNSGACVPGNRAGPTSGNCTSWDFFTCPILPSWVTLGNNPAHTGESSSSSAISRARLTEPTQLYNYTYRTAVLPVVVADGLVFAVTTDAIIAHDGETGVVQWTYKLTTQFTTSYPTFDNNTIYVQVSDMQQRGVLYAIDALKGIEIWNAPYDCQWEHYLSPMVADNRVCVNAGEYGGMYCYEQATGKQLFFTQLPQYDEWAPASFDGRLFAYAASNFFEIDNVTGTVLWTETVDNKWDGYDMDVAAVISPPLAFIPTRTMEFSQSYNQIVAIDVDTHTVSWNSTVCSATTMPAVSGAKLYVPCNGTLYVLDSHDGSVELETDVAGKIPSAQPIVTSNEVIVAYDTGVYAYALPKLDLLWSIPCQSPSISFDGRLFITSGLTLQVYQV